MKDKMKLETPQEKNKKTIKNIKLYVIPIFAVSVFVIILLTLTIPKINQIFTGLDTISSNTATITENAAKIAQLDSVTNQYSNIVQNLSVIDSIAPLGNTEVVKFRDRVTDLINSNNLTIINQRLSEANTESDNQNSTDASPIILQEVPFIFTVDGTYENIVKFIQSLNTVEDFIVIKEMNLSSLGSAEKPTDWELKINIVKYQFNTNSSSDLRSLYINVPLEAELNDSIQKYIDARSPTSN